MDEVELARYVDEIQRECEADPDTAFTHVHLDMTEREVAIANAELRRREVPAVVFSGGQFFAAGAEGEVARDG